MSSTNNRSLIIILIMGIIHISCENYSNMNEKKDQINGLSETLQIHNHDGNLVAKISTKNEILDGLCEWYDKNGNILAVGSFKNGTPFSGTFLNWSKFLPNKNNDHSYNKDFYCQDWITIFEASFDSQIPDYKIILDFFYKGEKLAIEN